MDEQFINYPEFEDDDFYRNLYYKKEFYNTKSDIDFTDKTNTIEKFCNPDYFKLQTYQEFIKNYISTDTGYNGLLAFWGVGTGKCLHPSTNVLINDVIMSIEDVWNKYRTNIYVNDGYWTIPKDNLYVYSYNIHTNMYDKTPVNRIYSQGICNRMKKIYFSNGDECICTLEHKFYCENENIFTNNLIIGDKIKNIKNIKCEITDIEYIDYFGIVYDLEITYNNLHNYTLASGLLCHNTCGAVQIAEGLKDEVYKNNGMIYILAKSQIQANFNKELYSIDREDGKKSNKQCTGSTYYIDQDEIPDNTKRYNKIKSNIKQYYKIMGLQSFVNYADIHIRKEMIDEKKKLGEYFSNSVFIIDEAHCLTGENKSKKKEDVILIKEKKFNKEMENLLNLNRNKLLEIKQLGLNDRSTNTDILNSISKEIFNKSDNYSDLSNLDKKKIRYAIQNIKNDNFDISQLSKKVRKNKNVSDNGILTILNEIIDTSTNIKFILLTATPMKDTKEEFIDIINILRRNDRRSLVKEEDIFKGDSIDDKKLSELVKGYVSYVRGENPISFPKIELDHESIYIPKPLYYDNGAPFDVNKHIKYTKLIKCPMDIYQFKNYIDIMNNKDKLPQDDNDSDDENIDNDIQPSIVNEGDEDRRNKDLIGRQVSNVIFPQYDNGEKNLRLLFGNNGFKNSFDIEKVNKNRYVKKKTDATKVMSVKFYKPKRIDDFNIDNLKKYSSKMYKCLNNIIKHNGLHYVYSDFKDCGALLFALILEINGYKRFKINENEYDLLYNDDTDLNINMRCSQCGMEENNDIHIGKDFEKHKFKQAYYVLLTGDTDKNIDNEIKIINNADNKNQELVKVIIGTRVSGEGIDYKRIEHVHIIDPWHNNTRLYQVIGRASRHCSHIDLPDDRRIVYVYKYCATPTITKIKSQYSKYMEWETPDEKIYRRIETKDIMNKKLERVLKESAVDCKLNSKINHFVHDQDYSRECDYLVCDYKCKGFLDNEEDDIKNINNDTYNIKFDEIRIRHAENIIVDLYKYNFVIDIEALIDLVKRVDSKLESNIIFEAIQRIIGSVPKYNKKIIYDQFNRAGYLIYKNKYYIFQPNYIKDERAPLYYKVNPITIKQIFVDVDDIKNKNIKINDTYVKPHSQLTLSEQQEKIIYMPLIGRFSDLNNDNIKDHMNKEISNFFIDVFKLKIEYILSLFNEFLNHFNINDINVPENEKIYSKYKLNDLDDNIDIKKYIFDFLFTFLFKNEYIKFYDNDKSYYIKKFNEQGDFEYNKILSDYTLDSNIGYDTTINLNAIKTNIHYNSICANYLNEGTDSKFKIKDTEKENIQIKAPKLSKSNKQIITSDQNAERSKSRGRVCKTENMAYLINLFNKKNILNELGINGTLVNKDGKIDYTTAHICKFAELYFIHKEFTDFNHKYIEIIIN